MSEPWAEFDCPRCGLDEDFFPPPQPGSVLPTCGCGHHYTDADMRSGNFYDDEGECTFNPFRLVEITTISDQERRFLNPHTNAITTQPWETTK